jgi:lambda repressor-like predicted transcriptional regulator
MVRRNYTEDDVAEAILDITDRGLSQNEAAQKRGVPQSTLSGRLSGQASRNERIQAHQRILKSQEETLIRWVLRQESLGYALSHSQLRACVEAILKQQGDNKPLGKHWTTKFVKRHLELSTKLEKRQEAADLMDLLRRRSIGTSISGRTSTAGSSLRTQLTWTRAA